MKRLFPFLFVFSIIGCTYTFNPSLPPHIKSLAIPVFENETLRYGIEEVLTIYLIEAFIADGSLKVRDEKKADSVILGKIVKYEKQPYLYDEYEKVSAYRITVGVDVVFKDKIKDKVLWEEKGLEEWGTYIVENETEEDGIKEASNRLKDTILKAIAQGW